jgi:FAD/FMN-containing dehydrogenase/Fe-S oxidoreductase
MRVSITTLPLIDAHADNNSIDVAGLHAALTQALAGEVRFDRLSRALYSTDASVYQIVPLGVVVPRSAEDVRTTLALCRQFRVPVTARGGGTSQAGQAIGAGIQLDCSKYFNRVLEINAAARWARVEPGCVLDDLNLQVKPLGLQFAPDISTSNRATIGGMVANNSSGTHSVIHGKTLDHVLALQVLLSDGSLVDVKPLPAADLDSKCCQQDLEGECYRHVRRLVAEHADDIERRYPKILRRVGGYDLHALSRPSSTFSLLPLLVGSEGTLAVTLEAKLRLIELPRAKALLLVEFDDLLPALAATPAILQHGPAAVEVLDRYILDSTRLNPEASRLRDFLQGDPGAVLIIEFYADSAQELPARLEALETDLHRQGVGTRYLRATDQALQSRIWKLRKLALGLSMAEKGDAKAISFVEDTAVASAHLRDYIEEFLALIKRHGTTAGVYAHASVGCLHVRPIINLKTATGVRQFEAIAGDVADLVLRYGGALSGEHGDGLVRSPFQEKMYGPALYQAFRELKRTFDPLNLLNPGKIVDAPPLSSNLRYGPAYVTPDVTTTFDFSRDGGLARAAELCAGVGECRKSRDGTMCPSYQATREELHSTRGRANALRLALTGQLGLAGLSDPALHDALDLCLECKACKAECPTNVDMARLKAEFLHQYHQKHGLPWRNWIFGNVARLSRWGSKAPTLWNWWTRGRRGRWLNEWLGIDQRRQPPALAAKPLAGLEVSQNTGDADVVLFADTFTHYYEPQLGLAAMELIRQVGLKPLVVFPDIIRCCGRPMISNGMLTQAVAAARHNVQVLYPLAASGKLIVACEPSCILTIKDDYPPLLRGEERRQAETIAARCLTIEEVLDKSWAKPLTPDPSPRKRGEGRQGKRILVQGHCHQRALVGMGALVRLLRRIDGAEVVELDAGCCGLAGSFGYEKEHYEVSRLVGEHRLFPLLRQARPTDVVVAPGFSCRMQIEHFTGIQARHPVELLHTLIGESEPEA